MKKSERIRREIQIGIDDLEQGRRLSGDEVIAQLRILRPGARLLPAQDQIASEADQASDQT
jgi:hypothetical protein